MALEHSPDLFAYRFYVLVSDVVLETKVLVSRRLEDKKLSLGLGLGLETQSLGLGLESRSLGLGLGLDKKVLTTFKTLLF